MSSVFGHPWLGGLFADDTVAQVFAADADLQRMIAIETAWIEAQADVGTIDSTLADRAVSHLKATSININDLRDGTAQDGLPVPRFVNGLKVGAAEDIQAIIHTGLTSQDVMDTSLTMALQSLFPIYRNRLDAIHEGLHTLVKHHGTNPLIGYTRMQAALPITAGVRIDSWSQPFGRYIEQLGDLADCLRVVQCGGPVGMREVEQPNAVGRGFAKNLGLRDPGAAWHTTRQDLVAFSALLTQIAGSLGKMGQDIALMAQRGANDIMLNGGGTSSAMPHKDNPIKAELLVTLAHHCAALQMNMTTAMIHEQERSGAMWALEWMVLPDLLQTSGRSMTAALELITQIERIGTPLAET